LIFLALRINIRTKFSNLFGKERILGKFGKKGKSMLLYDLELSRLIDYLSGDDPAREKRVWESYDKIVFKLIDQRSFDVHILLRECHSFEEAAKQCTEAEGRRKPLTISAVRKRAKKAMTTIRDHLLAEYEKTRP
jgi:hypothetical protein